MQLCCLLVFLCRPLNGKEKIQSLCVLCDSSVAGGEIKDHLPISLPDGLRNQAIHGANS